MNDASAARWRHLYDRYAPALALICLITAMFAVGWSYTNDRVNREQDQQRIADAEARAHDNTRLLACFDDFATDLAGGLPKVRSASTERTRALSVVLRRLQTLLVRSLAGDIDRAEGVALGQKLVDALKAYRVADEALTQVQQENPYPDPPSEFCPVSVEGKAQ